MHDYMKRERSALTTVRWLCGDGGINVKMKGLLAANVLESDERR